MRISEYDIPTAMGETISIKICEPNLRALNLSLETWASSYVLSSQLHHLGPTLTFPPSYSDEIIPVLEIGAGTGLVGLPAAALWGQPVLLTDLEQIVPALEANIKANAAQLQSAGVKVQAGILDWEDPATLLIDRAQQRASKAHVIIAADVIYSAEQPALLANVINHWLHRHMDARLIFAWALRACYLDEIRDMWSNLEEAGLEAIQEGQDRADESRFTDECLVEWSVWKWKDL